MSMRRSKGWLSLALLVVAAIFAAGGVGQVEAAMELNGSMALGGLTVSQNGANLSLSTMISAGDTIVTSVGTGDYSGVPTLTSFGANTLDLTSLTSFMISNALWGSFAASSGFIVQQTTNFLDVFLSGTFTPGPSLAGFDPSPTSLRFSINQSGDSVSEAITLASPPASVPEPATLMLLGSALLGVAAASRRRRAKI
jgi:hypothetical protein